MELADLQVIVVGAALGGATAALLLARAGAKVTLLEKVVKPRAIGAGIAIAENGLTVLESLGLGPDLSRLGAKIEAARVVDGRGRTLLEPRGPQPRALMLRRSDLYGLLLGAVEAEERVTLQLDAEVLRAAPAGSVVVRTERGEATLMADLVLGADGVHSRVRQGGDFRADVQRTGVRYARMLVPAGLARGEEAWTRQGLFGSFALADGTYVFASAQGPSAQLLAERGDLSQWKEAWARAYAPAREILSSVGSWDELVLNEVIRVDCGCYFDGRLALLGDAAHAMAPNVGQGGNSAIVDAAVLTSELRSAHGLATALERYDARRRPAVRKVANTAERLGKLASWTNPLAAFARDQLLLPVAQRLMGPGAVATVLQETAADLAEMCRFA